MAKTLSGETETAWKALISHTWTCFPQEFKNVFSLRAEHVLFCDIHNKTKMEHERPDFTIQTSRLYWKRNYLLEGKLRLTEDVAASIITEKYYIQRFEDLLRRSGDESQPTGLIIVGREIVDQSLIEKKLKEILRLHGLSNPVSVLDFPKLAEWLFIRFSEWAKAQNFDRREIDGVRYALEQDVSMLFPNRKILADDGYRSTQARRLNSAK